MAGLRAGREHRAMSEINVTPLVDVMLVLLIIFMVTAPLLQQGLDVDLPETTTQPLRMRDEPLILTVKKDGSYHLANQKIALDELEAKLGSIRRRSSCAPTRRPPTASWSRPWLPLAPLAPRRSGSSPNPNERLESKNQA